MDIKRATKTYTILMGLWIIGGICWGYFHSVGAAIAWFLSGMTIPYLEFEERAVQTP